MSTYGERLEQALLLSGRTRKELCGAIGVTLQALGQVLSGKTKALTSENSAKAAKFLRVSHYWLATGEGSMEQADNQVQAADERHLLRTWRAARPEAREVARYVLSDDETLQPEWADKDTRKDVNNMRYAALCWLRDDQTHKKIAA